jgi:N-acetylmuramic acid 6-phosphate etherase
VNSITELANPKSRDIDRLSTLEIVSIINDEDKKVAAAVSLVLGPIARAVDLIAERLSAGGQLFYVGTGTSGRLGVLDASEWPPTFGVSTDLARGIIAGGYDALRRSVEGAEDQTAEGALDLQNAGATSRDVVVGISASGNTPYTVGAVEHARGVGAATIGVTCNPDSKLAAAAGISIAPVVGPEVISGSSRMKAGTAQKMVLNMLSTGAMIKMGLVYGNLMSNLQARNEKLRRRALAILVEESGLGADEASRIFESAGQDLRLALIMARADVPLEEAQQLLKAHGGSVRRALDQHSALDQHRER